MKNRLSQSSGWSSARTASAIALALFAGLLYASAQSGSNTWSGTAFDTNSLATATTITSISDGEATLNVGYSGTSQIILTNALSGHLLVNRSATPLTIHGDGGSVSKTLTEALALFNGNNVLLAGGSYTGGLARSSSSGPPTPISEHRAVWVDRATLTLSNTTVVGGTTDNTYGNTGAYGLQLTDSTLYVSGSNTLVQGGDSGSLGSAAGGHAIFASYSGLNITNGTFAGGSCQNNSGGNGSAIYAINNSSITILDGSFMGGEYAGPNTTNAPIGGSALTLQDNSQATLYGGTYKAGSRGVTFDLLDSSLSLLGGNVTNGSLVSHATTNALPLINLQAGAYTSLVFSGSADAMQTLTTGTAVTHAGALSLSGGQLTVTNQLHDQFDSVIAENGSLKFTQAFTLRDGGTIDLKQAQKDAEFWILTLDSGSLLDAGTNTLNTTVFSQQNGATNRFTIAQNGHTHIATQTAYFNTNAVLQIHAEDLGLIGSQTNTTTLLSTTVSNLFFTTASSTNLAAGQMAAETTTNTSERLRLIDVQVVDAQYINARFRARALKEFWGLTNNPVMESLADELDDLGSTNFVNTIDSMAAEDSLAAAETAYFSIPNTFQTVLQGQQAAVGQAISRGGDFRELLDMELPGPNGPTVEEQWNGWAKYYGQLYNRIDDEQPEYDTVLHGGVIGIDRAFGPLLIGIMGGAGATDSQDTYGATALSTQYHGGIYSTIGNTKRYVEMGVAYGHHSVDTKTSTFLLEGEFDANMVSYYSAMGYGMEAAALGLIITPEVGLHYADYEQDAYTETSVNAVGRVFPKFEADSLQSKLGLNIAMLNPKVFEEFSVKPEFRFHWMHEYNPEPDAQSFHLVGGNTHYDIQYPWLDEDHYRVGFGMVFRNPPKLPQNVMFRVDFDERFNPGKFYSHQLSGKILVSF